MTSTCTVVADALVAVIMCDAPTAESVLSRSSTASASASNISTASHDNSQVTPSCTFSPDAPAAIFVSNATAAGDVFDLSRTCSANTGDSQSSSVDHDLTQACSSNSIELADSNSKFKGFSSLMLKPASLSSSLKPA